MKKSLSLGVFIALLGPLASITRAEPWGPEDLVRSVLAGNNRMLEQRHATAAAERRSEGAGTWENPMLMYGVSPGMLAEGDFVGAHQAEISQAIPLTGKTGIEKKMAENEVTLQKLKLHGTAHDLATQARLQYAEHAELLLIDDSLHEEMDRLEELHQFALAAIGSGKGNQADALMIEMELHMVHEREIANHANLRRVEAEINKLAVADVSERLGNAIPVFPAAVSQMREPAPDVQMASLEASNANLQRRLAAKKKTPDLTLFAGLNTMWKDRNQWAMVGVRVELPVRRSELNAASESAQEAALAANERAKNAVIERQAMAEKAEASLEEADQLSHLYAGTSVPLAARRLASAKAAYGNGQAEIRDVIDALRAKILNDTMQKRLEIMKYKAYAELALANGTALLDGEGANP